MTDREKLLQMFYDAAYKNDITIEPVAGDRLADYLLANGVTVQKHGRWIHKEGEEFSYCSVCNYPVSYMWNMTNYCPNCGVKMGDDST